MTVEFVAIIPMLAALTLALIGVVLLSGDQVLVTAAAREGARAAALGQSADDAAAAARAALPGHGRDALIRVERIAPGEVSVRVRLPARLAGSMGLALSATAVAAVEPDPPASTASRTGSPATGTQAPRRSGPGQDLGARRAP